MGEKEWIQQIIEISKHDLKEIDVREEIITPLLSLLGYSKKEHNLFREYSLKNPYMQVGSQKQSVTYHPDYLLKSKNSINWIIESKNSNINIHNDKIISQAFFYMNHPEVKADYFLLCNGKEISLYKAGNYLPILNFKISELKYYYPYLKDYLSNSTICVRENKDKDYGMYLYSKQLNHVEHAYYDIPVDTFFASPSLLTTLKKDVLESLHLQSDKAVSFDIRKEENGTIYYVSFILPIDLLMNNEIGLELKEALYKLFFVLEKQEIKLSDYFYSFSIAAIVSDIPLEGIEEIYYPLIVTEVLDIKIIQK